MKVWVGTYLRGSSDRPRTHASKLAEECGRRGEARLNAAAEGQLPRLRPWRGKR